MVTIDDVEKYSFRFLAIPREAKPHCSTLHTSLSRAAHVDVNTVEPTLSDTEVRDRSRIRTEKQDTEKHNVRQDCRNEDKSRRRDTAVRFTLEASDLSASKTKQLGTPQHTKDMSLPVISWEMLCLHKALGPVQRAPGSGEGTRHPVP